MVRGCHSIYIAVLLGGGGGWCGWSVVVVAIVVAAGSLQGAAAAWGVSCWCWRHGYEEQRAIALA